MFKKIIDTTASSGLGDPSSRKLFKIVDGEYAGRLLAIIQTSPSEIVFTYADGPCSSWSAPEVVANDAANTPFDAVMAGDGHVWLVYTEQSSYYLVSRKMTFTDGAWTVGNKVDIYNGSMSLEPSVSVESSGKLWVSWSRLSSGYYDIQVKSSTDGGASWGSGATDPGESIAAGLTEGYSRIIVATSTIHAVYSANETDILARSKPLSGGAWSSEFTIGSGTGVDHHFDASVAEDGLLGVIFDAGQLRYREYDGSNWSSVVTLDEDEATWPQLSFNGNVPMVTYLADSGAGQQVMKYVHRRTGSFSAPVVLDPRAGQFDSAILYDSVSATYADVTEAARSAATGDVYHPSSGCLLKSAGDTIYLGMERRYRFVTFCLSTSGAGGTVSYAYFDGSNWKSFTPAGSTFNLDEAEKGLLLWDDYHGIPADWQANSINGQLKFWVRVEVSSAFSTGPVGSMLTAVSNLLATSVRR